MGIHVVAVNPYPFRMFSTTMTRINAGVPPSELTTKHLVAEHREIKRIPNVIRSGRFSMRGQPPQFTLGKGHVKFFYDKLLYLKNRYAEILGECRSRGFHMTDYSSAFEGLPDANMGDYSPSDHDATIIRERIALRLGTTHARTK